MSDCCYVYKLACHAEGRRLLHPSLSALWPSATDRRPQADTDPVLDKRAFELFIESVSEAMCKTSPRPHPWHLIPFHIAIANVIEC